MTTAQDQQSRSELLPCPFCGGAPETTGPWEIGVSDNYETCICCEKCGFHISSDDGFASGEKQSLAKAIDRWNRRAPAEQAARALPAGMEPVAGQCRFAGDLEWRPCAVEHVRMVLAAPQEWEGYEVRCLYVAAPLPPAAQKRYRLLVRNVDTIQADDEFLRDDTVTWQADPQGIFVGMPYMSNVLRPARRAIEPTP